MIVTTRTIAQQLVSSLDRDSMSYEELTPAQLERFRLFAAATEVAFPASTELSGEFLDMLSTLADSAARIVKTTTDADWIEC